MYPYYMLELLLAIFPGMVAGSSNRTISILLRNHQMFLIAEEYLIVYMYPIFFISSSVEGHLGCFPLLAVINNAFINIVEKVILWDVGTSFVYS